MLHYGHILYEFIVGPVCLMEINLVSGSFKFTRKRSQGTGEEETAKRAKMVDI